MAKYSNVPGFFMCPRYIVDEVALALTREELLVMLFAMRHILGWDETFEARKAHISMTMFAKGRKTKTGTVMKGTGLGETALRNALNSLVDLGLINRVGKPTENGQLWELPVEYDTERMLPRIEARQAANLSRIAKARASRGLSDKGGVVQQRGLRRTKGGEGLSDKGTPAFVGQSTYIDTSNIQEINTLASDDAQVSTRLYPCSSKDIAALITAWWNWLPSDLRPTQRGRVVESSKHYANKTHRQYAEVLIERGYTPGDVIEWWQATRTAMKFHPTKAYSKMTTMPFGWVMSQVESFAANKRHQTLYTNDAPRCLPWKADEAINGNTQVQALLLWQEGKREEAQGLGFCVDVPGRIWTAAEYELLKAGKPLPEDLEDDDD
jgi:hypothetical protein